MRAASASRPLHTCDQQGQAGRSESSDGGHDEAGVGELRYAESQLLIEGFERYRNSLVGRSCVRNLVF
jgi:hypothetical protein